MGWTPFYVLKLDKANQSIFADKEASDAFASKYPNSNPNTILETDSDAKSESGPIFCNKICFTPLIGKACVGTELGEFCFVNFGKLSKELINERNTLLLADNEKSHLLDEQNKEGDEQLTHSLIETRLRLRKMHFADIKSLKLSPHFGDIYLSVSDWRFGIWFNDKLIFLSPYSAATICCACWSMTRPAVIFLGKIDGTIDVYDLLDATHCALIGSAPISSSSICSLTFCPFDAQLIGVGDGDGNCRILQLPRSLCISSLNDERKQIAKFYKNEAVRIQFIDKRMEEHKLASIERDEERQRQKEQMEKENDAQSEKEEMQSTDDERLEQKYNAMLQIFNKQIGKKNEKKA